MVAGTLARGPVLPKHLPTPTPPADSWAVSPGGLLKTLGRPEGPGQRARTRAPQLPGLLMTREGEWETILGPEPV